MDSLFFQCFMASTDITFILGLWTKAVNYVAVSEALGVSPSVMAAGIAAENVICAMYFTALFALASKIPPEASSLSTGAQIWTY